MMIFILFSDTIFRPTVNVCIIADTIQVVVFEK